jgi:pimeloyl-ACP methyl ester carboxylesterase
MGQPLLLVHAAMLNWRLWAPVLSQLTAERDVLAPTLPGHLGGPSLGPSSRPFIDACVDHLEAEMDAARFDRVDIVGNSLGGWCALELARRGRAHRLVGIAPVGMHTDEQALRWVRLFDRARTLARRTPRILDLAMASAMVRRKSLALVADHGDRLPATLARDLVHAVAACDLPEVFAAALSAGVEIPAITMADEIDVPVLLLWGNADRLVGRDQIDRYLSVLPDARLVELPGLGHCPQLDDPERLAVEILGFVGSGEGGVGALD